MGDKITAIIPAFNEAETIGRIVSEVKEAYPELVAKIIVIDDGSSDRTAEIARENGAHVIVHARNLGYGASLKSGIRQADTEWVLTLDADGQHRVADIGKLCFAADQNDMVVGQRQGLIHSRLWRMPGKWSLSILANYLSRRPIPDLNSGLRLIRRGVVTKYLHLCPSGFSFSTTITMVMLNRGYRVAYIPIEVSQRLGRSTVTLSSGLDTLILILRIATLFDPLRVFLPASLACGLAGVLWGIPYAWAGRGVSVASLLAIMTGILLFSLGLICDQISQMRLERYE